MNELKQQELIVKTIADKANLLDWKLHYVSEAFADGCIAELASGYSVLVKETGNAGTVSSHVLHVGVGDKSGFKDYSDNARKTYEQAMSLVIANSRTEKEEFMAQMVEEVKAL